MRIKKDITIRFIPNILSDEGRTLQSFPFDRRWTIRKYLKKSKIDFEGMRIIVNSNEVKSLRQHLQSGDEIIVAPTIEWPAIVVAAKWIAAKFIAHWVTYTAIILSTAYSIYSALTTKVKMPSYDTSGEDADSPSSSWTGVKTSRDPNGSVPIIYGRRLTGGTIINEFITNDGEKNYLNSLVGIGEGPLHSITLSRINKNNASNFSNYTIESRLGTNDQSAISGFDDLHDIHVLNVKLEKDDAYIYTTQISDLEAFEIILQLPSGIYQQDSAGNLLSWAVTFKVEYKIHTDPSYTDLGGITISGKTNSTLQKIFRKDGLATGQYDIRITRISADPSDLAYPITAGDLYLTGVDEINTDNLAYPNTGASGIKALTVEELSGDSPNFEFMVEGREILVPKVMNGAVEVDWEDYYWDPDTEQYKLFSGGTVLTWDGTTYVVRFCANPIWCLYDLMTNTRCGLGDYITTADHDLDFLLEKSRCCEERVPDGEGGYEKRFRLDICIDSPQQALELIMQLAGVFRGLPFYSDSGKMRIAIDEPDTPVQLFGMDNIIKDSFSQSWGSKRDIPNIVHVQYDNNDNYYEQDMISVVDEESLANGEPKRIKQVRYYGTKLSYAIRFGRFVIKAAKYVNRTITIKGGIGAIVRQCGELIDIAHDVPQWGFSGCVLTGSTTTKVKLDRTVVIESGKSYAIRVDFAEPLAGGGPRYEEKIITDVPGSYTEVNVNSAFTKAPAAKDSYVFGELNKMVMPARIVSLKRERMGNVEMICQEYNEDIYDDTAVVIPTRNVSSLSFEVPNITALQLTERIVKLSDGSIENVIDVWFDKPSLASYQLGGFKKAKIYLSDDAGLSWQYRGETPDRHFAIMGGLVDGISYQVMVVPIGSNDQERPRANCSTATLQMVGKSAPPSNVTGFIVKQSRDRLTLIWQGVSDVDLSGYEIRYGASWDSGEVVVPNYKGSNSITLNIKEGASQSFWIKAIDTSGNYSTTPTEALITVDNVPFTNIINEFSEQTAWAGTKTDVSVVGNNLEIDSGHLQGTYLCPVRDQGYVATFKIGIDAVSTVSGDSTWQDYGELGHQEISDALRFLGEEIQGALSFEVKTSDDNITWSAWEAWQPADYKCRYFQIRMTLTRASLAQALLCSQLDYFSDLPDVDEVQDATISTAANGVDITFVKDFHDKIALNVVILTGSGFVWKATNLTTTGATIKIYDLSGTLQTGDVRVAIHGV